MGDEHRKVAAGWLAAARSGRTLLQYWQIGEGNGDGGKEFDDVNYRVEPRLHLLPGFPNDILLGQTLHLSSLSH